MTRSSLLGNLAVKIAGLKTLHPLRVGIDGVDGAGKTRLAEELLPVVSRMGRSVIRASIDDFHNSRAVRYARGRTSPEGYFRDSFNLDALVSSLLQPLGPGGSRHYRCSIFDYRSDEVALGDELLSSENDILLFDGVFLHQPKLLQYWDFSIFINAPFEITIARMAGRDGRSPDPGSRENRRYVDGQKLYIRECSPAAIADLVMDNSEIEAPKILRNKK